MKKILLLTLLLGLVVSANAGLTIYVKIADGLWADYADSKLTIAPSDEVLIGVMDMFGEAQPGFLALGLAQGPGSINAAGAITLDGVAAAMTDDALMAEALGVQNPFISMDVTDPPAGLLIRDVLFHCDGPGDVTIAVVDEDGLVQDTQVIHQVPEPMTLALLGLGGLALRFRKR